MVWAGVGLGASGGLGVSGGLGCGRRAFRWAGRSTRPLRVLFSRAPLPARFRVFLQPCPAPPPASGGEPHTAADLLKVCCLLNLADGLHERVAHEHGNVGTRVALGALGKLAEVRGRELVRRVAEVEREHLGARVDVRQRDVDASLKAGRTRTAKRRFVSAPHSGKTERCTRSPLPTADGGVEHPRNVGGSEHEHTGLVVAHT